MKVNYIGIACLAVLLLTACDESKYELENLVPEEYHKVLYINKSGTQELTLYNTGELNTYAFSVYKGGSDPSLTASGEIAVHSQEEVDVLYGADYRIIPSGSYSMDTDRLDFASEERSKVVTLSLSTDLIGAAMEANPEATYVLPLYLTSEKDSVNADKSELFIRITDVLTPAMGFTDTDIQPLSYTYGFNTESVEVGFGLDTDNNWDVECQFVVDPGYVTAYNAENGTAYKLFPEAAAFGFILDSPLCQCGRRVHHNVVIASIGDSLDHILTGAVDQFSGHKTAVTEAKCKCHFRLSVLISNY